MKKICWITPDCFIDVDIYVIRELSISYNIFWTIIESPNSTTDNQVYIDNILGKQKTNINISLVKQNFRLRDLRNINLLYTLIRNCKKNKPDLYYVSALFQPYGALLYKILLPTRNVVFACHNVTTPIGATDESFAKKYTYLWLKFARNINVFSKSQKKVLETKFHNKNILYAPLAIKDYGVPSFDRRNLDSNYVRFLSFGNIVDYKRIDILIEAGNILFEKGIKNFSIRIAGKCQCWNKYQALIRHPEVFDLKIERIPNEDIPNLFAESQYFVMPYQDIAQSGAITIAFRYNLPTIVSDIPQFEEFVQNGKTGITFKSEDAFDLADKMQYAIEEYSTIYNELCKNQEVFVKKILSINSIKKRYLDFFEKL